MIEGDWSSDVCSSDLTRKTGISPSFSDIFSGNMYSFFRFCERPPSRKKGSPEGLPESLKTGMHRIRYMNTDPYFRLERFLRSVLRLMSHIRSSLFCLNRESISSKVISEGSCRFFGSQTLGLLRRGGRDCCPWGASPFPRDGLPLRHVVEIGRAHV